MLPPTTRDAPAEVASVAPSETPGGLGAAVPPRARWLLVLAMLFGATWMVARHSGSAEVRQEALAVQAKVTVARDALQKEHEAVVERVRGAEARINVLEARRMIHRAVLELQARNFGTAEQVARRAGEFLPEESPELSDARVSLLEFSSKVTPDVGEQIAVLEAAARTIDETLPLPAQPLGADDTEL